MEQDLQQVLNMKLILCMFQHLSRLKMKFHKSEVFCLGKAKDVEDLYTNLFGCEAGLSLLDIWEYPFTIKT
jgi:hypothetical protein